MQTHYYFLVKNYFRPLLNLILHATGLNDCGTILLVNLREIILICYQFVRFVKLFSCAVSLHENVPVLQGSYSSFLFEKSTS
jgi:hypothetical protein